MVGDGEAFLCTPISFEPSDRECLPPSRRTENYSMAMGGRGFAVGVFTFADCKNLLFHLIFHNTSGSKIKPLLHTFLGPQRVTSITALDENFMPFPFRFPGGMRFGLDFFFREGEVWGWTSIRATTTTNQRHRMKNVKR